MDTNLLSKENLERLVAALLAKGEDAGELGIWKHLWDALSDAEKKELISNLEKELKDLG